MSPEKTGPPALNLLRARCPPSNNYSTLVTGVSLRSYKDIDINFDGSRECKFLEDLAEAVEAGDKDQFTQARRRAALLCVRLWLYSCRVVPPCP